VSVKPEYADMEIIPYFPWTHVKINLGTLLKIAPTTLPKTSLNPFSISTYHLLATETPIDNYSVKCLEAGDYTLVEVGYYALVYLKCSHLGSILYIHC
jgi:hypothetical protein